MPVYVFCPECKSRTGGYSRDGVTIPVKYCSKCKILIILDKTIKVVYQEIKLDKFSGEWKKNRLVKQRIRRNNQREAGIPVE